MVSCLHIQTTQHANIRCMHLVECLCLKESEEEKSRLKSNLEKILQKKEKFVVVEDFDVEPGCPPGENFVAEVLRVVVYGRRLCLGTWTDFRKNFIVKRVPGPGSPNHGLHDPVRFFDNEITAYEHVLPMCRSFLEKKSQSDECELCFPRFYGQCQWFLVLQDLQTEGYQVVNRIKGYSMRECSLILQELSKFHALSFALKQEDKFTFSKTVEKLKETVFWDDQINEKTGDFWENSVKLAARSLKDSNDPKFQKALETLSGYSGRVRQTLMSIIKSDTGKFDVLCHGDLWNNNILLRYCESGYPIGVKFIDLQAMRYTSCVLDVMHVLFTSSRPSIYDKNFGRLLSDYFEALESSAGSLDASLGFTFEEFLVELKRKVPFGMLVACLMFTCVTKPFAAEPPDFGRTPTSQSNLEEMYAALPPGYHQRLRGLFLALVQSGLV